MMLEKRMRKVCAKCGRGEEAAEFIGAFCPNCAPAAASCNLPARVAVDRCPRCGRIRRGKDFFEPTNAELCGVAVSKLRGSAELVGCTLSAKELGRERSLPAELHCTLASDGKEFLKKFQFEFAFGTEMCDTCRKIASGYHEGILQLRGEPKRVEREAERFRQALVDGMVTKEKQSSGGVDLFIAERDAMMKLVMEVHRPYTATRKLKGVKKGRHQFITTVCIRY
jgi:NMD protein affecting ribosome stability and mRNA decay